MLTSPTRFHWLQLPISRLVVAGLTAFGLSVMVPSSADANDYETCTGDLLTAGIAPAEAATACARALIPQDLSTCVTRIRQNAGVTATDALATCVQVRRPVDLATCVVGIRQNQQSSAIPEVLDNCRRSLLPVRYGECVVGLARKINSLTPTVAMNTCIDARDTRQNL
ncbi:MAG: hypothetical protein SFW36_15015 [Leptolyngbyaceae cyanobacterium bins.59]|nr:hypothetical protein [Leptolyngbyaceae cyanobacterium bins.59]